MVAVFGLAALTVDVGAMYNARADLQKAADAADAAALASASTYTTDTMMQVRLGAGGLIGDVFSLGATRVGAFAAVNPTFGSPTMTVEPNDIAAGWINLASGTSPIRPGDPPATYNVLQVVARRTANGANGPRDFLFSSIFGVSFGESSASAVAVFDDQVSGFDTAAVGTGDLMPFTIHEDVFAAELAGGFDNYGYNPDGGIVVPEPDGLPEIKLYPYDWAPGNFGLLNIGTLDQGIPPIADQIENGVPPADVEAETGSTALTFVNDEGGALTYNITGSPGLDVPLQPSIETRIGDVVAFCLHDLDTDGGSNTVYRITDIRFGRVMDILLQGASFKRGFWIQPVSYAGAGVRISEDAPSTNGLAGRIVLAR